MADYTDADFNSKNLWTGVGQLDELSARGKWMEAVDSADFELRTNEKLRFLTGYIANLLDRIERLESERTNVDDVEL